MKFPRRPNRNTPWGQWANDVLDWLQSTLVQSSPTVKATQTTRGIFLEAKSGVGSGSGDTLQFRDQWVDGEYDEDDIVICKEPTSELDDGRKAGTFIATTAIQTGDMHPGLEPQTALATAVLDGDEIGEITVDDPGAGYSVAPVVTITGDGTGATAVAVLDGGTVSEITVTNPGSGYTSATISIAAPDQIQKWKDFALGRWPKLTLRPPTQVRNKQRIIFNAGRDSSELPVIQLLKQVGSESVGSVTIDLADIPVDAGDKIITLQETYACDDADGTEKLCLVLRSGYYDP